MNYEEKLKISTKKINKDLIEKYDILNGARHFSSAIFQDYLIFTRAYKCIKYLVCTTRINLWKSNGLLEENIENIPKSDSNFAQTFFDHHTLPDINFNGHCLLNNNIFIPKKLINICIYIINPWLTNLNKYFTLNNCLVGSVKLIKNADPD